MCPFDSLILPPAGHWHKKESCVPRYKFGKGAKHDFSWYFKGESGVSVRSVKQICKWLRKCKYVSDEELFFEEDFWQHPITFESLRKGDCDDHALWAWRKLLELEVQAEFVSGEWLEEENGSLVRTGHAWVNFNDPVTKRWNVLESTAKSASKIIIPFSKAEKSYFPRVSIDGELKTYRYTVAKKQRRC